MLWTHEAQPSKSTTNFDHYIVIDKIIDHAKPYFDLHFEPGNIYVKENVFSERELRKVLRDTLMRAALSGLLSKTAN